MSDSIDFVVTWVNGNDASWLVEKEDWLKREAPELWLNWTAGDKRFRDWGLMRYWFRAIERFTPWFNRLYFVTWGHYPEWLNTKHPKLQIVRHDEFIPKKYLPTFNSHTIEFNLHRIDGLSEQFVYFNDDLYVRRPLKPEYFFKHGLPRDFAGMKPAILSRETTSYEAFNSMIITEHFDKNKAVFGNLGKWINPKYGISSILQTLTMLPYPRFRGFQQNHLPYCFLKSTFEKIWELEYSELDRACSKRFRDLTGVSPHLILDWQRASGQFVPIRQQRGCFVKESFYTNKKNRYKLEKLIIDSNRRIICINDGCDNDDFEFWQGVVSESFERYLPNKSNFEID